MLFGHRRIANDRATRARPELLLCEQTAHLDRRFAFGLLTRHAGLAFEDRYTSAEKLVHFVEAATEEAGELGKNSV